MLYKDFERVILLVVGSLEEEIEVVVVSGAIDVEIDGTFDVVEVDAKTEVVCGNSVEVVELDAVVVEKGELGSVNPVEAISEVEPIVVVSVFVLRDIGDVEVNETALVVDMT